MNNENNKKQSKRAAAKEWRRQRRKHRAMARLGLVAFCLAVILGIGYIAWDLHSRTYVMTFNGQRIATDDMRFFTSVVSTGLFGGGGFGMDPRVEGLERLTQNLLISEAAQRHGLTVTAEELEEAEEHLEFIEMLLGMQPPHMQLPNMSTSRMIEFIASDSLSMQLLDIYTADFVVDEEDFQAELGMYLMTSWGNYVDMEFRVHTSDSMAAANVAFDDLFAVGPDGYNDIILRDLHYATGIPIEELEVPTMTLNELREMAQMDWEADWEAIQNLPFAMLGDIPGAIRMGEDTYFTLIVDSMEAMPDEEIAEIFRERYEWNERASIFSAKIEEWRDAADIRINERGINTIVA